MLKTAAVLPGGGSGAITRRPAAWQREEPECAWRLLEIVDETHRLARIVRVRRTINVGLLDGEQPAPGPGDRVLVHVGFALSRIDEARATLRLLQQIGADYEQELEELKASAIEWAAPARITASRAAPSRPRSTFGHSVRYRSQGRFATVCAVVA